MDTGCHYKSYCTHYCQVQAMNYGSQRFSGERYNNNDDEETRVIIKIRHSIDNRLCRIW